MHFYKTPTRPALLDSRASREDRDAVCEQIRRRYARRSALLRLLIAAVCVAALVLVAYLKWGG